MDLGNFLRVFCISTLLFTLYWESCGASTEAALNSAVLGHGRDIDPTSFIVTFEESNIGESGALATIASVDAPSADVFVAAAAMKSAAAAAADRISDAAAATGIHIVKTRAYGHVFAGMSVQVATVEDAGRLVMQLKADPAVKDVIPVVKSQVALVPPADPQDAALNSVQAAGGTEPDAAAEPEIFGGVDETTLVDLAHTEFTGEGVKVGVIDDGLDFTHPVFGGCTAIGQGANCRVIAGHDFTDDDDITYESCGSHGTHVGGIIAGDSNPGVPSRRRAGRVSLRGRNGMNPAWKGVAYKALLGAYRVFNCEGSVTTEWLLGALDQAVADGMNIINLSMGTSWAAPLGLSFASRLARQGVLVVAAAGNDGSSGLWTYGHPAAETDAIAVGSTDNKHSLGAELKLNVNIRVDKQGSTSTVAATARAFMATPMFSLPKELVLPQPLDACDEVQNKNQLRDKVVLVSTGNCTEAARAKLLLAAGAASVLFYDHNPAPAFKSALSLGASVGESPPQMFATDLATGQALTAALRKGTNIMITRIRSKEYLHPNAERPSWFSSWGPDINMRILPTFSAPGGAIFSSVPGNNFATFQGTSMATPYACGSLALWVQSRKELGTLGTGKDVLNAARSSFINTALPVKYDDQFVQPVVRVGAGLLQVASAINNKVNIWPSTLTLPTGLDSTTSAIALTNTGSEVLSYQLQHTPAMSVSTVDAWYQQEQQTPQAASVKFTAYNGDEISSVTLQPGQTLRIKVVININPAMAESPLFYSGYLRFVANTAESSRRRRVWAAGDASLPTDAEAAAEDSSADAPLAVAAADPTIAADIADSADGEVLDNVEIASTELLGGYPSLSIPYLGLSQPYSKLPVVANPKIDVPESSKLAANGALLCNVLISKCTNAAGMKLTTSTSTMSLGVIGFALSLSRPVESLFVEVYDADTNMLLGKTSIAKGPLGWQGPKTLTVLPVHATASYWHGDYTPVGASTKAVPSKLQPGNYRFVVVVEKPVAVADRETANAADYVERIEVMGQLEVSEESSFWGR